MRKTIDVRLVLELVALAAIVAAVYLATLLIWAALLAFAVSLAYLAYIWEFKPVTVKLRRPSLKGLHRHGTKPTRR